MFCRWSTDSAGSQKTIIKKRQIDKTQRAFNLQHPQNMSEITHTHTDLRVAPRLLAMENHLPRNTVRSQGQRSQGQRSEWRSRSYAATNTQSCSMAWISVAAVIGRRAAARILSLHQTMAAELLLGQDHLLRGTLLLPPGGAER